MKIVGTNVTRAEADKVEKIVRRCVKQLMKPEYGLNLPASAPDRAAEILEVKKRPGTPSRAGAHTIRINLGYWQMGNPIHREYKSFNEDRDIGQIDVCDDFDHLMVSVSHEVAHHIQFYYGPYIPRFKMIWTKPHGQCFREIYRILRRDLINPSIRSRIEKYGRKNGEPVLPVVRKTPVFHVNQKVEFSTRTGIIEGTVVKVNPKNLRVQQTSGNLRVTWDVSKMLAKPMAVG